MKLNYINFYGYLLRQIDAQIGTVVDELYKEFDGERLADNAIIVRTADHGEMGLSHGGMRQKAFVAYEEALRVPMVISNPVLFDAESGNKSSDELATLIDIVPTLCDLLNIAPPEDCRGTSLLPIVQSGKSVQNEILFTFDDTKSGSSSLPSSVKTCNRLRSIRTKTWKFTYYFDVLGAYETQYELYDLNADPTEYTNLAYDPIYASVREELFQKLKKLEREKLLINYNKTFSSMKWVETNPNFDDYAYNELSEEGDASLSTY